MSRVGAETKKRILAVYLILETPPSYKQIAAALEREYGITVDRKTLYDDVASIESLEPLNIRQKKEDLFLRGGRNENMA